MLSFSKFVIFISILITLPTLVNIIDNLVKIFKSMTSKIYISDKITEFDDKEFSDFILEFLNRTYKYRFEHENDNTYICEDNNKWLLYSDNSDTNILNSYEFRNILGLCESKGSTSIFIFTTKVISNEVKELFNKFKGMYNIKYIHGEDLRLDYRDFVSKFYY